MTFARSDALLVEAQQILLSNDRGDYTIPTQGLYPFQWNWDASVTAVGWMTFRPERAWRELRTLLSAQWRTGPNDGLLPSIAFHHPSDTYFPGPSEWGCEADSLTRGVATTSISQPPLHATMVRAMLQINTDDELTKEHLPAIVDALVAHHRWWYSCRDPHNTGLVMSIHPWESGMDNSPAWDSPLSRVPRATRSYARRDTGHVHSSMRPTQDFYDRVVYLMDFNRSVQFDPSTIAATCPYRVQDIGIISVLNRASIALSYLCDQIGRLEDAQFLRDRCDLTKKAVSQLWSDALGQYVSRDAISGDLLQVPTNAGFLTWYGLLVDEAHDEIQLATLNEWLKETTFALPSTRQSCNEFSDVGYWRGPIWQHINSLIADGLDRFGHRASAQRIHDAISALFTQSGFCENYNPITGAGQGGASFSWTAATYLYWQAIRKSGNYFVSV